MLKMDRVCEPILARGAGLSLDLSSVSFVAILVLRDAEELPSEEAAEILGESVSTVKSRLHRARMALREVLTRRLAPPSAAELRGPISGARRVRFPTERSRASNPGAFGSRLSPRIETTEHPGGKPT